MAQSQRQRNGCETVASPRQLGLSILRSVGASLLLFVAAACGGGGGGGGDKGGGTTPASPVISEFSANPTRILVGHKTLLKAAWDKGTGTIDQGVGAMTSGGTKQVTPTETTTYQLTVTGDAGSTPTVKTLTVTVAPVPEVALTVDKPEVTAGEKVKLTATFPEGLGAIDGIGPVQSGVASEVATPVSAVETKLSYTLVVDFGQGITRVAKAEVRVIPSPVATGLASDRSSVLAGGRVTLTPTFSGGTGTIDQGVGPVESGRSYLSGPVNGRTTFTLTVANALGAKDTRSVVVELATPGVSVAPLSTVVAFGGKVNFTATVIGIADTTLDWSATGGSIGADGVFTAPNVAGSITVTARVRSTGATATASVDVVAPPSGVSLSLAGGTTAPVLWGALVNVKCSFQGGTGSLALGNGQSLAVVDGQTVQVGPVTTAQSLTLTVTNGAGEKVVKPLNFGVQTVAVGPIQAPPSGKVGGGIDFSAVVTGAADNTLTWSSNGEGVWTGASWVPTKVGQWTVTARHAPSGVSSTATITVVPANSTVDLVSDRVVVSSGANVVLTITLPSGISGTIDQGIGTVQNKDQRTFKVPDVTQATDLILTLTAADGGIAKLMIRIHPKAKITSFTVQ